MTAKHSNKFNESVETTDKIDYIHYGFTDAKDSLYPSTGSARAAKRTPFLLGGAAFAVALAFAGVVAFNAPKPAPVVPAAQPAVVVTEAASTEAPVIEAAKQTEADRQSQAKQNQAQSQAAAQRAEAQNQAKKAAEQKAKAEAEAKAKKEAEAKKAAEAKAKREAEQKAKAKREAEQKAKAEAEAKAKREAEAEQKAKLEAEAEAKAQAEAEEKAQKEAEEKAAIEFKLRCDRWEADKQNLLRAEEENGNGSNEGQADDQNQADDLNQTDEQNPAGDANQADDQNPAGDANQGAGQPQDATEPQKEDAATAKAGTDLLTQALKDAGITDAYTYVRTISKAEGKTSILATLNGASYQIDVALEGNTINQVTIVPCQA